MNLLLVAVIGFAAAAVIVAALVVSHAIYNDDSRRTHRRLTRIENQIGIKTRVAREWAAPAKKAEKRVRLRDLIDKEEVA